MSVLPLFLRLVVRLACDGCASRAGGLARLTQSWQLGLGRFEQGRMSPRFMERKTSIEKIKRCDFDPWAARPTRLDRGW